jgi:hypothetical protein
MSVPKLLSLADLAKKAIECQDACNLFALMNASTKAAETLRKDFNVTGTAAFAGHPVIRMWIAKMATLAGFTVVDGDPVYLDAWDECKRILDQEAQLESMAKATELTTADDYEVIVGNIGSVHFGTDLNEARKIFAEYKAQSETGTGRAGGEGVTLLKNGDIYTEHLSTLAE